MHTNIRSCILIEALIRFHHNFHMLSLSNEKKLLQIVIVFACLIPLSAGLTGILRGAALFGGGNIDMDSHFRYLSGLLLGIGLGFLSAVPRIETQTLRIRLLTIIVVIGGIGRLVGLFLGGIPSYAMLAALIMELAVTPLICLWQHSLARRFTA